MVIMVFLLTLTAFGHFIVMPLLTAIFGLGILGVKEYYDVPDTCKLNSEELKYEQERHRRKDENASCVLVCIMCAIMIICMISVAHSSLENKTVETAETVVTTETVEKVKMCKPGEHNFSSWYINGNHYECYCDKCGFTKSKRY